MAQQEWKFLDTILLERQLSGPLLWQPVLKHASVHLKPSINGKLRTQLLTMTPPVCTVEPTQLVKFNFLQRHRDLAQMLPSLVSLL